MAVVPNPSRASCSSATPTAGLVGGYIDYRCEGDIDGDGLADLLVLEFRNGPDDARLIARSFDLPSGKEKLQRVVAMLPEQTLLPRGSIQSVSDADRDGRDDWLVSYSTVRNPRDGRIELLSAKSGAKIWRTDATARDNAFGSTVFPVCDVDHDGVVDLLVIGLKSRDDANDLWLISGKDGRRMWSSSKTPASDVQSCWPLRWRDGKDAEGLRCTLVCASSWLSPGESTGFFMQLSLVDGETSGPVEMPASSDVANRVLMTGAFIAKSTNRETPKDRVVLVAGGPTGMVDAVPLVLMSKGHSLGSFTRSADDAWSRSTRIQACAAPDFDHDGVEDVAVVCSKGSRVDTDLEIVVVSSADGRVLSRHAHSWSFGAVTTVEQVADVDKDGDRDLALGFVDASTGVSLVEIVSVKSGATLVSVVF